MPPIRVLIVDDSVVVRKLLSEALASSPQVEVAGTASNGAIALARIPQLHPDVITLDIEMPVLNGLQTLAELRKQYPKLPVIMFSTLTERGAASTLEALSLGASDYVTKPTNSESLADAMKQVRQELLAKITSLAVREFRKPPDAAVARSAPTARRAIPQRVDILAIGTSTGGPNALMEVLPGLPADLPIPVVIVQHMPPLFTKFLAERLGSRASLPVHEGGAGEALEPGKVWIAPGDYHMIVERRGTVVKLAINQEAPENYCRPAVDPLFRSVARIFGAHALAVILTGMGSDGMQGARHIREQQGQVLAQDEATSVVWGMPGHVVGAGLADAEIPLGSMAQEIVRRVEIGRMMNQRSELRFGRQEDPLRTADDRASKVSDPSTR
jgi:two-component system chemotaxis response regulator CheB